MNSHLVVIDMQPQFLEVHEKIYSPHIRKLIENISILVQRRLNLGKGVTLIEWENEGTHYGETLPEIYDGYEEPPVVYKKSLGILCKSKYNKGFTKAAKSYFGRIKKQTDRIDIVGIDAFHCVISCAYDLGNLLKKRKVSILPGYTLGVKDSVHPDLHNNIIPKNNPFYPTKDEFMGFVPAEYRNGVNLIDELYKVK